MLRLGYTRGCKKASGCHTLHSLGEMQSVTPVCATCGASVRLPWYPLGGWLETPTKRTAKRQVGVRAPPAQTQDSNHQTRRERAYLALASCTHCAARPRDTATLAV